ncbi:hypothetical protein BWI93_03130 [Siphonobacter sp. BAB-5385]|uniref:hypothetical protein n=1 Tax=Siphonobacter sp. BAB-5385 TaxID=1864822 RepID=UPI000B9E2F7C|nr:hypothetical protein [Siphonobacter sp. BAB-5385]OZI09589.1 hypothetical protein BWI93_03130 [Siphonobacter sp. BAB-5385]
MKDKIKERLKAKFSGVNLSEKRMDAIADKLKVSEESEIDDKLDELNELFPFADMAKHDDRERAKEAFDKKKQEQPKPDNAKVEEPQKESGTEEMPAWFKAYSDKVDQRLGAIETGKQTDTRKSKLAETLSGFSDTYKKIVEKNFSKMAFANDDEFDAFLADVKTDGADFQQTEANTGLGSVTKPAQSGSSSVKVASKDDAVVKGVMNAI